MKHPNIIVIIADHQAFYGHHRPGEYEYIWPRYEQFCAEGTRFERAYSVCPICTPARSSMMTGLYPSKHGLIWNTGSMRTGTRDEFKQGQKLYSHYLADAGYRNAYIGKWHCGEELLPEDYGIEGWALPGYGKVYMSEAYKQYSEERGFGPAKAYIEDSVTNPEWTGQTLTLHNDSPWHFMNCSGVLQGPPEAHEEQFVSHLAIEKLNDLCEGSKPWSLIASFWGPHQAYFPSQPFASMIDPDKIPEYPTFDDDLKGRPLRHFAHKDFNHQGAKRWTKWSDWQKIMARAYAQGLQTDAAIGDLLDALEESGQAENTIVIWTTDHGDALASHGGLWDKASTYTEEVARVPLAIRWPKGFDGGKNTNQLVSNLDITSTILDAAGVIPEKLDSRSLLPLCKNTDAEWPENLICEHNGHDEPILQRIILHKHYKYVAALYDGDELYDLNTDPYELDNLIDQPEHRAIKAQLRQGILDHIKDSKDPLAFRLAHSLRLGF